jgi:integrase/recombinase XerD
LLLIISGMVLLAVVSTSAQEIAMPHDHIALIAKFRESLTEQRYHPVAVQNYCRYAAYFLGYLTERKISVDAARPNDVSNYLRCAARRFRKHHSRSPGPYWTTIPRAAIHGLLRRVQKRWPPEPVASGPGEALCRAVCTEYREWLSMMRGLAVASVSDLMWEARRFLSWYIERATIVSFMELTIQDIDAYFEMRAPGLRRKSRKDVAQRLRSLVRYLHSTGRIATDLAPQIIAPMLYSYESIPAALSSEQITAVLKTTGEDQSPMGLRDYAILQLLSTYGMRAGEIKGLRLDDVDWRAETLRIRHSKTGRHSLLPLMEPVGESLLNYLRRGRPQTDVREIFIRTRAPYRPLSRIYSEVRRRLEAAGVKQRGKCGPHTFRHARAVSLLRASVPRKVIGDLLGHRSVESTIPYLKLATEDLRAIALEIPGQEARS